MKRKLSLLPRMAVNNIRKNGKTYFPYIGVSIFAMFTYFVFDLIQKNDVMKTVPKAAYALVLVNIGFVLLGLIMIPFLYYTNSFLIKRRKRELGLYSILGLEKKHIGIMMFWESLVVYGIVMAGSILLGLLFSRLIFLLLLNMARLSVDASFSVSPQAILDALLFYALITGLNLLVNLIQVGKARPVELMSGSSKGEKEPKHIGLMTLAGSLAMGWGYYLALISQLNADIFGNFFLAVLLVVAGTHLLFTAGSVTLLRFLKKRKKFYYRADNFVTVSGMLYRMKKSAASLSNICIFGTMTVITLICTLSVWFCIRSMSELNYPHSLVLTFLGKPDEAVLRQELEDIAEKTGVELKDYLGCGYVECTVGRRDSRFGQIGEGSDWSDWYRLRLMDAEEFGRMEGSRPSLEPGEALFFSNGPDYGQGSVSFGDNTWMVKEELTECRIQRKVAGDEFNLRYLAVLPDEEAVRLAAAACGVDAAENHVFQIAANPAGEPEQVDAFMEEALARFGEKEGFAGGKDYRETKEEEVSMYGSLVFIGIFFSSIFLISLLIIMYYKQITEGFEDQKNFEIMQKVGMSDGEIKKAIRKQILLVFALPLVGAILHTVVGMNMVIALLAAIRCVERKVILICFAGSCLGFAILYGISYKRTSSTYYRIVKKMS